MEKARGKGEFCWRLGEGEGGKWKKREVGGILREGGGGCKGKKRELGGSSVGGVCGGGGWGWKKREVGGVL